MVFRERPGAPAYRGFHINMSDDCVGCGSCFTICQNHAIDMVPVEGLQAISGDSGERLWSMATGSTIGAAPASYAVDDVQYVLLPAGVGGGLQYAYPELHAVDQAQGPTRLIAFSDDIAEPGSFFLDDGQSQTFSDLFLHSF